MVCVRLGGRTIAHISCVNAHCHTCAAYLLVGVQVLGQRSAPAAAQPAAKQSQTAQVAAAVEEQEQHATSSGAVTAAGAAAAAGVVAATAAASAQAKAVADVETQDTAQSKEAVAASSKPSR